jgi:hypothetical protein
MATHDIASQVQELATEWPALISREQAREILGLRTARTIDNLIGRGELKSLNVAGRPRIPRGELVRYLLRGVA